jgi:iron complex transport system ATP-binding protein
MSTALSASAITVTVGTKALHVKTLLDDISIALEPGEMVALVGPNGAGKSTLLRVLSGELKPRAGTVNLKGRALASYRPRTLAGHRAVLSQSISVAFPFTVAEIVRMGAGDARDRHIDTIVEQALAQVDLLGFHDRVLTTLSGGEQQRAHFARVLVQLAYGEARYGPGVLLLDEPTASLDLRHQLDIVAATKSCAARGVTVVAVLHDLNLAALLAGRIVVLDRGRIDADGTPADTITDVMLARVFGIADAVGRVPTGATPFVLPHAAGRIMQTGSSLG